MSELLCSPCDQFSNINQIFQTFLLLDFFFLRQLSNLPCLNVFFYKFSAYDTLDPVRKRNRFYLNIKWLMRICLCLYALKLIHLFLLFLMPLSSALLRLNNLHLFTFILFFLLLLKEIFSFCLWLLPFCILYVIF